jgi:regulator of sigma E protease
VNLQFVLDLALFAAVIGVMIMAHELGHFFVARAWRIRIDEFGIGFPPRLATLFTSRGTRFTLNWIPLGGFVRPAGEDDPSVPDGLAAASRLARATVLLAGPLANFLLAFVAFTAAFKFASPDPTQVLLTSISRGSPAEAAGLQAGDIVTEVDGRTVTGIEVLRQAIADSLGEPAQLTVRRGAATLSISILPRTEPPPGEGPIGVTLGHPARQVPWAEAVSLGVGSVGEHLMQVLRLPGMWLRGELSPDEARITGLKGMYDMLTWAGEVDRASQRPFVTLTFLGFISASLGLANLLPIPALDGGRLLFVGYEAVFGKRVAPRYEGLAHAVGFALLLALMVYVNFQDFLNPVPLPP